MKLLLTVWVIGMTFLPGAAQKADTTASAFSAALPPAPVEIGLGRAVTISGYLEAYYVHDVTAPRVTQERPVFLYNHKRNREVNINVGMIKAAYLHDRIRGNLALQVGTYAQYNYASELPLLKNVFEANAGVKLSQSHDVWLDAGIFSSHIGFESALSKDCWTLTRSIMAENSPYYLAGMKLTYNSKDNRWTLLGAMVNGWQRIKRLEGSSGPSFSTQVQYHPTSELTLNWSSFLGSDRPDSLQQRRLFNNLYAILQPAGRMGVILGFDIGVDYKPLFDKASNKQMGSVNYVWYSPVVITRYKTSPNSYLAARAEYYDDPNGEIISMMGPNRGFKTFGFSTNYDYSIRPNALLRIEGKLYQSPNAMYETSNGLSHSNISFTTSLAVTF